MTGFPPSGEQCIESVTYADEGKCAVTLKIDAPESTAPSNYPNAGPSRICWEAASSGPFASSIASGDCEEEEAGCKFTLIWGLNIEPIGKHDPEQHYEFWHGDGSYNNGGEPIPTGDPIWAVGYNPAITFD